jgi:hypothetical protein
MSITYEAKGNEKTVNVSVDKVIDLLTILNSLGYSIIEIK